uniref:Phosphatidylserine synthase n=1 Tax=Ascaris lumbricoides TaxID=6252 RepID=A0A0M3HYN0_ASCLU
LRCVGGQVESCDLNFKFRYAKEELAQKRLLAAFKAWNLQQNVRLFVTLDSFDGELSEVLLSDTLRKVLSTQRFVIVHGLPVLQHCFADVHEAKSGEGFRKTPFTHIQTEVMFEMNDMRGIDCRGAVVVMQRIVKGDSPKCEEESSKVEASSGRSRSFTDEHSDETEETSLYTTSSSHMRRRSRTEVERIYYQMINERVVNDVTLEFFYKPHTFALFQNFSDIKLVLKWLDPEGLSREKLEEKAYAVNCSDVTLERIWSYMDIFVVGHFLGWAMKALLIRHSIICWYISIAWEITEVVFAHLLPNFQECWWDAIVLDVLLCNGLGIWFGTWVARFFEMRQFHWESIKDIKTTRGKLKRAVLQFTPESWIKVDWYNNFALRRTLAIYAFVMIWLISELNTFFLKHIFAVDTSHPLVFWRIVLIAFVSAPSIRQFYLFATDPRVKRMGMQSWVYLAVCALEAAICIKFGRPKFPHIKITFILIWIAFLVSEILFIEILAYLILRNSGRGRRLMISWCRLRQYRVISINMPNSAATYASNKLEVEQLESCY